MIRFFDIIFSIIGLVILSPIFIVLYLLIRIESKGGGFYSQERIGKNGKPFKLYKFRSMRIGSDKKGLITIGEKDNRITKTGFILRKYKLDELPQLWNVFIGDMSLVGPRPDITDWASIKYVDENKILGEAKDPDEAYVNLIMPNKIKLNMVYIQHQTLGEYFKIIFTTFKEIVR